MTDTATHIAMIGAGFISAYHLRGLQEAGARVEAIYSHTRENAARRAAQFGIPRFTDHLDEILGDAKIQAVVIATPDFLHKDHAIAALRAGKAVLLQKPMARNAAECREILAAARETGTELYVSFMHRYFEEVAALQELLAQSALGTIGAARQRNATPGADWAGWFYQKENVGGGVLLQLGAHGIDLLRYLFGEIVAVRGEVAQVAQERRLADGSVVYPDAEDLALATYRFASGMLATHECSYAEVAGTDRFRLEIYGAEGTAWLRSERGRLAYYAPRFLGRAGWLRAELEPERVAYRQHRHFLDMLEGKTEPDDSARDGLASALVAEAVYRAAASGSWEEVETI